MRLTGSFSNMCNSPLSLEYWMSDLVGRESLQAAGYGEKEEQKDT